MTSTQRVQQLLEAIRATTNEDDLDWDEPPSPIPGGFWAQLWRVRLTTTRRSATDISTQALPIRDLLSQDLVARIMPDPDVAARETLVQTYLGEQDFPTPRVRLSSGPTKELPMAWMLMDFAEGEPLMPSLSSPTILLKLPSIARSMPDTLADCAASLHQVSADQLDHQLGQGEDAYQFLSHLRHLAADLKAADLVEFADSLSENQPSPSDADDLPVICHGDLHPFNVLVGSTGYVALDWSAARIANRCHDLAFTNLLLSNPPLDVPAPLAPVIRLAGRGLARRFLSTYQRLTGVEIDPDQFAWHTRLHALRALVEIDQWKSVNRADSPATHPFLLLEPLLRRRYLGNQV